MGRIRRWLRGTLRADRFEADEVDAGSVNTESIVIKDGQRTFVIDIRNGKAVVEADQ